MFRLQSFGTAYRALVIGNSGALGQAFCEHLRNDPGCAGVTELGRATTPAVDLEEPASIAAAAQSLAHQAPYQLIVLTSGLLHRQGVQPEKSLAALEPEALQAVFQVNALGPAMILRDFLPLLDRKGAMAVLSARVGSIGDNRLGGWYSYRASKAALNMLVKTASIEVARTHPLAALVALHPGTVNSALSAPFNGAEIGRPAADAAGGMLRVLDGLPAEQTGSFHAYSGEPLPW